MANILIIDDDASVCKMLSDFAKRLGHNAAFEYNIHDGLNAAASYPCDIVFLDVQMPDGSGLDLLPKIKEARPSAEVIIMTGFGSSDGAEIAIKNGAWDYVQKPLTLKKIMLPLKRILQYHDDLKKAQKAPVALNLDGIIGNSPQMKACFDLMAQAANSDVNVLLTGETGTGKELFAHAIHKNSPRADQKFVVVDCTALPETLVESLLFGHEKGAFTGADESREGLILQAHSSTLFLDEIGELPLSIQKVFLRVLQEHLFRPVGGKKEIKSDFRLIAATNRNLDQWVQAGRFRSDLLYRIRALTIDLPPLRERSEDIGQMIVYYVNKLCKSHQLEPKGFAPEFIEIVSAYHWPGNVRELVKTLEVAITAAGDGKILFPKHLPEYIRIHAVQAAVKRELGPEHESTTTFDSQDHFPSLKEFRKSAAVQAEKEYLQELVTLTHGDIKAACRISRLSRSRLYGLLKQYKISIPS